MIFLGSLKKQAPLFKCKFTISMVLFLSYTKYFKTPTSSLTASPILFATNNFAKGIEFLPQTQIF